jgi:pimeloyl-ACP methyl ester carboxylesterase
MSYTSDSPGGYRDVLLACGIVASLTYVATDIVAGVRYPGYSFTDQTVSELFAIGAPTSRVVVPLFALSSTLLGAFAFGVWSTSGPSRALRSLAVMMFLNTVNSLVLWNFFPMHMRGVTPTFTDAMHVVLAINPFVLLSVVFGIGAFKGWFRSCSAATVVVLLAPAVYSFSYLAAVAANQPTPGMGLAERVSQYGYQSWQAVLAVVLLRGARRIRCDRRSSTTATNMPHPFTSPEGETAFWAAYDAAMQRWPVSYEGLNLPSRFGSTHVIVSGPTDAPPLVLLHGYMATSAMWTLTVADFANEYRVYAIDVMGQASKSLPDEPIRSAADYVTWLTETLNALHLDRVCLLGMSYGGWVALTYAVAEPARVHRLVLLSAGGFLPMVKQFSVRGMVMVCIPTRFMVDWFMGWLGVMEHPRKPWTQRVDDILELMHLGLKYFRTPPETLRVMPTMLSDGALRGLHVPTLVLFGEQEVIYNPATALDRARRLMPDVEGDLIPDCRHDMCISQYRLVDARVLEFLKKTRTDDRAATISDPWRMSSRQVVGGPYAFHTPRDAHARGAVLVSDPTVDEPVGRHLV